LGWMSSTYRRRLATNSSRIPASDTLKSDAACDPQPYYSGEKPHALEQQRERPAQTCELRMSGPSVAVAVFEECRRREKDITEPAPLLRPRLCQDQQEMAQLSDRLVPHELLEKPKQEPLAEG